MELVWTGIGAGTKSDGNDYRNWIDRATGVAPASGRYPGSAAGVEDDVYFDAALATLALGCTTNCDFSAGAIINSLRIGPAYDGDIGIVAAGLKGKIREGYCQATLASNVYIEGAPSGYTPGIGKLIVNDGVNVHLKGTITDPVFLRGVIDCAASMTILGSLTVNYISSPVTDVQLTLNAGMTLPATLNIGGGTITNSNAITTLPFFGAAQWTQVLGDITTLTVEGGDSIVYWTGGNITTMYLYAGKVDGSAGTAARRLGDAYVYEGAELDLDNGQDNILVTGAIRYLGGLVDYPSGYQVTPNPALAYAGASDAKQGIAPQTVNNATVNGDAINLGLQDRLEIYCSVGTIASGGIATFTVKDSATSAGSFVTLATPITAVFTNTAQQNRTVRLVVWGHNLHAGSPWCRVAIAESGSQNAIASAVCIKSTF